MPIEFADRMVSVPNYKHVWFAHELLFVNSKMVNYSHKGSGICRFGGDYRNEGGDWARLCPMDSDNDGLTNGEELGDPCCLWNSTLVVSQAFSLAARHEYRRWHLTHPGGPDDQATVKAIREHQPEDCGPYNTTKYRDMFTQYYFRRAYGPHEPVPWNTLKLVCLFLLAIGLADWFAKGLRRDIAPWMIARPGISTRTSVAVCFASFVYMDLTSGIIHLILDYAPHWLPGLGGLARGFQYHHEDPTAIIRISWYAYVSHIHVLVPLILLMVKVSGGSRVQRLFWFWGGVFSHLFQTTHRWAHMPEQAIPRIARLAMANGILLSHERHMEHHMDLERQFTILSAHTDVLLDSVARVVPPARYDLWLLLGICWFLLPVLLDMRFRETAEYLDATSTKLPKPAAAEE